jgi:hypothetical protein
MARIHDDNPPLSRINFFNKMGDFRPFPVPLHPAIVTPPCKR